MSDKIERAVAATALIKPDTIPEIILEVDPAEFTNAKYGRVVAACSRLQTEGESVDYFTVSHMLEMTGELARFGGISFLTDLASDAPNAANARSYARQVAQAARGRRIQRQVKEAAERLENGTQPEAVSSDLVSRLQQVQHGTESANLADIVRQIEAENIARTSRYIGLPAAKPWNSFADSFDGLRGFSIIGADANAGKTVSLVGLTIALLRENPDLRVIFASLDDSQRMIIENIATALSWDSYPVNSALYKSAGVAHRRGVVTRNNIRRASSDEPFNEARREAFKLLVEWAESRLIVMDATEIRDAGHLEAIVAAESRKGPTALIIDSMLQLPMAEEHESIRVLNVERAMTIKRMTVRYDVATIASVELRKPSAANAKPRDLQNPPTPADLLETSKLSYVADSISMLYAYDYDEGRESDEPRIVFDISKNKLAGFRGKLAGRFHRAAGVIDHIQEIKAGENDANGSGQTKRSPHNGSAASIVS